jgi:CBS domain-containing protein
VLDNDRVAGVVSIGDVVNAVITTQRMTIRDLEQYICGGEYVQIPGEKAGTAVSAGHA